MELIQYLDRLKLTLYEKEIIAYLSSIDFADAKTICKKANIPQGRIYSVLDELQKKGFVLTIPGKPKKYQIKDIKESIKFYLEKRKAELDEKIEKIKLIELKPKSINIQENKASVTTFRGREEHLNQLTKFRQIAKKEIIQTAPSFIGTFSTKLSFRKALERGIKIRVIISKITSKNKNNIEIGLKFGAEIRLNKKIAGFSMMVKDSDEAIFSAHNYDDQEERVTIYSRNAGLISALKKTFAEFWKNATPITLKDLE
jgi:HTH-type transcriptional regulator, sugar sensing transcriptional regulator